MSQHTLAADGSELAPETAAKAAAARDALAERDGVLVAFSGGVDSSVVAALARDALGDDAVACTARSETLPAAELDDAKRVAGEIGIAHETVTFSELDDPNFVANDGDRCYHCRTMRLGRMYETAKELDIDTVCDGTNADDPGEGHRPGLRAVEELDVFSPLLDAAITKDEVREIAEAYDLSVADKPSMACLSSRIPTGLEVTEERLTRVEKAERVLREWGFEGFRVRDHDGLARVEIAPDELERALDPAFADAVHEHLTDVGFEYVTLDMAGYRTGSVSPGGGDGGEGDDGEDAASDEGTESDEGAGSGEDAESRDGTDDAGGDGTVVDLGRQYPR
ncbi:ATP-dependent sacrificial sulfur transferase LarE [Halorubrum sp. LN27]|uniref:ATP-dependent sacrificial sulfur transferase LarE n=1 Tax=Halorubrum sp. LN27 TaxID=2801032 RepID=UPI00190B5897|nr:ATP-dependent sacrificial sulfur transferase LarE [Halorubrum sp. LN27]